LAVEAAKANQLLYQMNYDDDYDATDGICARLTSRLKLLRGQFLSNVTGSRKVLHSWSFDELGNFLGWTQINDLEPLVVKDGMLVTKATGLDPYLVQTEASAIPLNYRSVIEIEMASDQAGAVRLYWSVTKGDESAQAFSVNESEVQSINAGEQTSVLYFDPHRIGTLVDLRISIPIKAGVGIRSIRIIELPRREVVDPLGRDRPVPEAVRKTARNPLMIPWEKQTDILPAEQKTLKPGIYLSVNLGLNQRYDYQRYDNNRWRLGVVFTVQARQSDDTWRTVFRRAVGRRSIGWEHWNIPLTQVADSLGKYPLRFMTDSYARMQNPPSRQWAFWGRPQLIEITEKGERKVIYDCAEQIGQARTFVRLDSNGKDRPFDAEGADSSGATFQQVTAESGGKLALPSPAMPTIAAFTPHRDKKFGVTVAEYNVKLGK